jgi:hypothetical protein
VRVRRAWVMLPHDVPVWSFSRTLKRTPVAAAFACTDADRRKRGVARCAPGVLHLEACSSRFRPRCPGFYQRVAARWLRRLLMQQRGAFLWRSCAYRSVRVTFDNVCARRLPRVTMPRDLLILPLTFLLCLACQPAHPTDTSKQVSKEPITTPQPRSGDDFRGMKTTADIAQFSWVNKRCRTWAPDGDIDVDQTCLVVRTVLGRLVVIPNEYVDNELKEILGQMGSPSKDKWILRFYEIGGGERHRN